MQKIAFALIVLIPLTFAHADEDRPRRRTCQAKLVKARFVEPTAYEIEDGRLESYEYGSRRGGADDVIVDRYNDFDARDPGNF